MTTTTIRRRTPHLEMLRSTSRLRRNYYSIDWMTVIFIRVSATSMIRIMKVMILDGWANTDMSTECTPEGKHRLTNCQRNMRRRRITSQIVRSTYRRWWSPMPMSTRICLAALNGDSPNCTRDWDDFQHRTRYETNGMRFLWILMFYVENLRRAMEKRKMRHLLCRPRRWSVNRLTVHRALCLSKYWSTEDFGSIAVVA